MFEDIMLVFLCEVVFRRIYLGESFYLGSLMVLEFGMKRRKGEGWRG